MPSFDQLANTASVIGFAIGLPTIAATYYQSWKARKEATDIREGLLYSEHCLEFVLEDGEVVNLVPLQTLHSLPKPGDPGAAARRRPRRGRRRQQGRHAALQRLPHRPAGTRLHPRRHRAGPAPAGAARQGRSRTWSPSPAPVFCSSRKPQRQFEGRDVRIRRVPTKRLKLSAHSGNLNHPPPHFRGNESTNATAASINRCRAASST